MTDKQFYECWTQCANYKDVDAYVSDLALSSTWGDAEDALGIPDARIDAIRAIWVAYHRSVKDIAAAAGLPLRRLAIRFAIPFRTMDSWGMGDRTPPDYLRLMMQECLGLIQR